MKRDKLNLKTLKVQSFVTSMSQNKVETVKGGQTGCPYVCLGAPDFTQDPNGCLSLPQLICDDPYGVTGAHAC
ncbi:MAG: pinensin family lanthipeptide [Bacteroidota bacterium]